MRYWCADCKKIVPSKEHEHWTVPYKKIRCPHCGNWGATRGGPNKLRCLSCWKIFMKIQGAFMDGVFLNKYPEMPKRIRKYVREGCKELRLSIKTEKLAIRIIEHLPNIFYNYPRSTAGAALYIAGILCQERRTQQDVADVMNSTDVTIRTRYLRICEAIGLDEDLPEPDVFRLMNKLVGNG